MLDMLVLFHASLLLNRRIWNLDSLGFYCYLSIFDFLIRNPLTYPLAKSCWKVKVLYKVKAFVWKAVQNTIYTNEFASELQLGDNKALPADVCVSALDIRRLIIISSYVSYQI